MTVASCQEIGPAIESLLSRRCSALRATGRRGCGSRATPRSRARRGRLDAQAADPLRALPEVAARHDEPGRAAVLRRERLAVVLAGDERLVVERRRRAAGSSCSRRRSRRSTNAARRVELDVLEQRVDADTPCQRMSSCVHFVTQLMSTTKSRRRQRQEARPTSSGPARATRPSMRERPAVERRVRRRAGGEHREVGRQVLAGRDPRRAVGVAGACGTARGRRTRA